MINHIPHLGAELHEQMLICYNPDSRSNIEPELVRRLAALTLVEFIERENTSETRGTLVGRMYIAMNTEFFHYEVLARLEEHLAIYRKNLSSKTIPDDELPDAKNIEDTLLHCIDLMKSRAPRHAI